MLDLSGAGIEAGYYEKGLAFIFAVLCGTAFQVNPSRAIDFKDLLSANNGDVVCLGRASFGRWNEATVRAILVALPGIVFALGVTRTSIGATFAMPGGLLMAVCIALSLAAASIIVPLGGMHCLVPFCLGELAFRAACHFGLLAVPMGKGCALVMLAVHGLCLLAVLAIAVLWHRASAGLGAPSRLGPDHIANGCSETGFSDETIRHLLNGAGLSNRELEVFAACSNGLDSAQVAQRLGMQASTVRTYVRTEAVYARSWVIRQLTSFSPNCRRGHAISVSSRRLRRVSEARALLEARRVYPKVLWRKHFALLARSPCLSCCSCLMDGWRSSGIQHGSWHTLRQPVCCSRLAVRMYYMC